MSKRPDETTSEQFERRLVVAAETNKKLVEFMKAGVPASSEEVLDVVANHHDWTTEFIRRDQSTYLKLANKYRTDDRFEGLYKSYADGLAAYLADAIEAYALARLTDDIEDEIDPSEFQNK
jgi:uncharacterized membrane-anchored protein YjiN (DUF445 family)